jgi:ParB family chromosome partitioning protein
MTTEIALNKLTISPRNVRIVSSSKDEDKQLIASIRSQGILQNLVVIQVEGEKELYEVVAGGRRLAALNMLAKDEDIAPDYPVPCLVKSEEDAIEASISENLKAAMHPADLFVAYRKLADEGKTLKDIAVRFGRSQKEVRQLLKLGTVSPVILDAFRRDELSLEAVMAFTLSNDLDRQESIYQDMKGSYFAPHVIRRRLVDSDMNTKHELVKFVTLSAYQKAGGTVTSDLFQECSYINDPELIEKLAKEKLEAVRESLKDEGWKWADVSLSGPFGHQYTSLHRLQGELVGVPEAMTKAIATLEDEASQLDAIPYEDWTDENQEREEEIQEEICRLEQEQEQFRTYTDEQKSYSGAVVVVEAGEPSVLRGFVKKEDLRTAKATASTQAAGSGEVSTPDLDTAVDESQALKTDLNHYRLQALQSVLAVKPDTCFELSTYVMAMSVLHDRFFFSPADIRVSAYQFGQTKDIETTKAAEMLEKVRDLLNLNWINHETDSERFKAFIDLSNTEKRAIHAYCVAVSLTSSSGDLVDVLAGLTDFDMSQHWQPTKDNYFDRLRRDGLLLVAKELKGDDFVEKHSKAKKGDLASMVAGLDEVKGWIPASIRVA